MSNGNPPVETSELELTNVGRGEYTVFNHEKQPVSLKPGQSQRVTVDAHTRKMLELQDKQGDRIKVGASKEVFGARHQPEKRSQEEISEENIKLNQAPTDGPKATEADPLTGQASFAKGDVNPVTGEPEVLAAEHSVGEPPQEEAQTGTSDETDRTPRTRRR